MFSNFVVTTDDKCKCLHCGEIVDRGIRNLMNHLDDYYVLRTETMERTKRMFDKFNNYNINKTL